MRREHAPNLVLALVLLTAVVSACGTEEPAPMPTAPVAAASGTVEPEDSGAPAGESDDTTADQVAEAVASRAPVPPPTPGPLEAQVEHLATAMGLAGKSFLGLPAESWIDLGISALLVVVGYAVGVRLLVGLLRGIVRRTSTEFDDAFLESIGTDPKWLVAVIVTRYALLRLDFLSDGVRLIVDDVSFILGLVLLLNSALKLISFGIKWYQDSVESEEDKGRLDPILIIVERLANGLVVIVAVSIGLSHFGINITALSVVLAVAAALVSLGAKDVISDAISGLIILLDQPFRVGDTIEIEALNKTGDVVEIGTRTTRLRTGDNRVVSIPNSKIGADQVVNYTYPDPRYRPQIEIGVAYGSDFDQVRQVIEDAVRGVKGVLPDKPVDILYIGFGDSARSMRVRWWIDKYNAGTRSVDAVSEAVEGALSAAGIDLPFNTQSLIVQVDPEAADQLSGRTEDPSEPAAPSGGEA